METTEVLVMVSGHVDAELLLRNEYLVAENEILFPESQPSSEGPIACKQRLGGVLKFYYRKAA